jgi:DNA-binding IclR family transcriptional regulator
VRCAEPHPRVVKSRRRLRWFNWRPGSPPVLSHGKGKIRMRDRSVVAEETPRRRVDRDHSRQAGETSGSLAPAVTRAATILDLLAADPFMTAGPSELSRRLGLPKSSIANICITLADAGLVRRAGSGFALGRRLAELGGAYLTSIDQVQEFHEACDALETASQETVQLAVVDGLHVVYIARHDGRQTIRLASEIGRRLPVSSTAIGKATLAALDPADLDERLRGVITLPRLTSNSHRTVSELRADLDEVRLRGYAVDNEETAEGIVCYGMAIPRQSAESDQYGASVTLLKARATEGRREALVEDLGRLRDALANPLREVGLIAGSRHDLAGIEPDQ